MRGEGAVQIPAMNTDLYRLVVRKGYRLELPSTKTI